MKTEKIQDTEKHTSKILEIKKNKVAMVGVSYSVSKGLWIQ